MNTPDLTAWFRAARRDRSMAVLEGFHPLKHALRFGATLDCIATADAPRLRALADRLAPDIRPAFGDEALIHVSRDLLLQLTPTPPGEAVMALARRTPAIAADALDRYRPVVYLERPSHLPNIGACVRVAAAAGAAGVIVSGPHDPWHAAALRGSAGLHFALPVLAGEPPVGRPLIALHPDGEPLGAEPIPYDAILAFGTERHGLSAELLRDAERRIAIPMRSGVSSLSLATAVAATLYAARFTAPPAPP